MSINISEALERANVHSKSEFRDGIYTTEIISENKEQPLTKEEADAIRRMKFYANPNFKQKIIFTPEPV